MGRRGWDADPASLEREWSTLERSLHAAANVLNDPQPGQGLESVWLRKVWDNAASIESTIRQSPYGWIDVVHYGCTELSWLVSEGHHSGKVLESGDFAGSGGISEILNRNQRPIVRLRTLAVEWDERFKNVPWKPNGFERQDVHARWAPWEKLRDEYIRAAGVLILKAVNFLEVKADVLLDRQFLTQVINSFDAPEYFLQDRVGDPTAGHLSQLIDELEVVPELEGHGERKPEDSRCTGVETTPENAAWKEPGPIVATSPSGRLKLFGLQHPVIVDGIEYPKLNTTRYNVLVTLCKAGSQGLTKDELVHRSGHTDAVGVLGRLVSKNLYLAAVVQMAGVSGGRYRVL